MTWRDYLLLLLPKWAKRPSGPEQRKLVEVLADMMQQAQSLLDDLVAQSAPVAARGAALDLLGQGRGMPRLPGEQDDQYRVRLLVAFQVHQAGGTVPGLLLALRSLGLADVEIIEGPVVRRYNGSIAHNGQAYYRYRLKWAEFALQLGEPLVAGTVRARQVAATVARWKPAHAVWRTTWLSAAWNDSIGLGDTHET